MAISTAAAIIGGSVIAGGLGARASRKASKAQQKGAEAGIAEQRRQFDISTGLQRPIFEAGDIARRELLISLGLGGGVSADPNQARRAELQSQIEQLQQPQFPGAKGFVPGAIAATTEKFRASRIEQLQSQLNALPPAPVGSQLTAQEQQAQFFERFKESAGQKFLRQQQEKSLVRTAAARGQLTGGNVLTALQEQAEGRAAGRLGEFQNRLAGIAGAGQVAATQTGQFGQQTGFNVANLIGQGAQARASGILGQNQAFQQGLGGVFTGLSQGGFFGGGGQTLPAANINPFERTA